MEKVGIRQMKAHLSAYVRKVHEGGARVAVTDRGRVVAVLSPPDSGDVAPDALASLAARVAALGGRPATDHGAWTELPPAPPELRKLDALETLDALRGDR